jgi:hypothetical protein
LRLMTISEGWAVGKSELVAMRGRQERVEAHVIELAA